MGFDTIEINLVKIFNTYKEVASVNMTNVVPGQMLHGQMLHGQMLHGQMLHGQMLHGQMLHGQMVLGHLSTVKDGSTSLKCPPRYFPWGEEEMGYIHNLRLNFQDTLINGYHTLLLCQEISSKLFISYVRAITTSS